MREEAKKERAQKAKDANIVIKQEHKVSLSLRLNRATSSLRHPLSQENFAVKYANSQ